MGEVYGNYAVLCRIDNLECHFIWYSGEPDGVVIFRPDWSDDEIQTMSVVFLRGLEVLRKALGHAAAKT